MKKIHFILSLLFFVVTASCNKDDENTQIITESINPVTDVPYIIFEDGNDLVEQLDLAFPIPTNTNIPSNAIERVYEINSDSTSVKVSFKINVLWLRSMASCAIFFA